MLIGETDVTNLNGIFHVFAINTTDNDIETELLSPEIIPFEYYKLPGENFDEDFADEDYSPLVNKANEVIQNLRFYHLNPEDNELVLEIVSEFPDKFYPLGEPLTPSYLVQHKIHTLDDVPLFKWGPEEEKSMKVLRQALFESPIVQYPDFEKPLLNYSATEKECLVVLYTVKQFQPYIYGRKFTLMSNHEPLRWIDSVKDPGRRLIRCRLKLRN